MAPETHWYRSAFDAEYLDVYAHRSDAAAAAEVSWALDAVELPEGGQVLDLCCGTGRHAQALADLGLSVVGVDLSAVLLEEAQKRELTTGRFVRGDMRLLPFNSSQFDAVFSFFTSFGYFHEDEENFEVLNEITRVVKPGGPVLLDFLNAEHVRANLIPHSRTESEESTLDQYRTISADGLRVEKKIVFKKRGQPEKVTHESVRLFSEDDLVFGFHRAGLAIEAIFGGLDGTVFQSDSSRLVLLGSRRMS